MNLKQTLVALAISPLFVQNSYACSPSSQDLVNASQANGTFEINKYDDVIESIAYEFTVYPSVTVTDEGIYASELTYAFKKNSRCMAYPYSVEVNGAFEMDQQPLLKGQIDTKILVAAIGGIYQWAASEKNVSQVTIDYKDSISVYENSNGSFSVGFSGTHEEIGLMDADGDGMGDVQKTPSYVTVVVSKIDGKWQVSNVNIIEAMAMPDFSMGI